MASVMSLLVLRPGANSTKNLAATAVSSNVQFRTIVPVIGDAPTARVYNGGTAVMFVEFGNSTVTTSTTTGMPIMPGVAEVFQTREQDFYMAAVTGTNGTIYVTPAHGL